MDHSDHVALIRAGVEGAGPNWADLGSGWGAFTLALADVLGPTGRIHSVDRDAAALRRQRRELDQRFPAMHVEQLQADFSSPLALMGLDGVVMANSLHFVREPAPVIRAVAGMLRPGGHLVLVEYDTDRGNHWVPHPLSFATWERRAAAAGLTGTRLLGRRPSSVLAPIYSALSLNPATGRGTTLPPG
ncbi:MAG: class I SAM-dependent methyltransferase [Candidatus Dormibacteraeota bacterium]|nr:class I SAM-dependent methyltransferase [Candidatus Dormibacteraeota bacterium]